MKWLNRIAQGFSPGYVGCSTRPERATEIRGFRPTGIAIDERSASGSVLVYVLVLVVIAGIIATSYLTFVDNQRATTERNLNQDGLRISTEQALLTLESEIRAQLLANGEVDLTTLNHSGSVAGLSLSLGSTAEGAGTVLQVHPFADTDDLLPLRDKKDLFGQARAKWTTIDVNITVQSAVPNVRLPNLTVNDQPQIMVREIPVSQFTIFSAANSFTLSPAVLSQDIGRVFSKSTISVSGSFSSEFPIVAGQNVAFTGGNDSLQVKDPSGNNTFIQMSSDTQSQDFLADARTSYDTRIVTGSVLPIDSAPLNSVYEADNSAQSVYSLNLLRFQQQCKISAVAQAGKPITTPNGQQGYLVQVTGNLGGPNLTYPMMTKAASAGQGTANRQTVAFAAGQSKQNPSQTILALDFTAPGAKQLSSIYLVVKDLNGNTLPNAVILIRGATTTGPVSIVSPHPIIIAGDFNDDSQPASIITPANLQTVAADWGSDVFGDY